MLILVPSHLIRTVYPVPWGNVTAAGAAGEERFQLHSSASNLNAGAYENALAAGNVVVHVRITDADYDVSAFGEDTINDGTNTSGVTDRVILAIERGSYSEEISRFGNSTSPITETSPTSGVFEYDQSITFTAGPSDGCPSAFSSYRLCSTR